MTRLLARNPEKPEPRLVCEFLLISINHSVGYSICPIPDQENLDKFVRALVPEGRSLQTCRSIWIFVPLPVAMTEDIFDLTSFH
jgi:hypothetical protein